MAHNENSTQGAARTVVVDLVVALLVFALGALVMFDSYRLGSSWASDGPQAGYFPFYISFLICSCSAVIAAQSLARLRTDRRVFVSGGQFRQVLVILLPSTVFVLGVWLIGIYVSSALFIALFMKFAGRYHWLRSAIVGLAVAGSAFVLFEIWFKIPLPKGPLEQLLGY
ncbi:MAG: tripartite tricarboxylate transporter TctB family protein [Thermodesulfobacteriota bacterium]